MTFCGHFTDSECLQAIKLVLGTNKPIVFSSSDSSFLKYSLIMALCVHRSYCRCQCNNVCSPICLTRAIDQLSLLFRRRPTKLPLAGPYVASSTGMQRNRTSRNCCQYAARLGNAYWTQENGWVIGQNQGWKLPQKCPSTSQMAGLLRKSGSGFPAGTAVEAMTWPFGAMRFALAISGVAF